MKKQIVLLCVLALGFIACGQKTKEEENKKIVTAFYNLALRDQKVQEAADLYLVENYKQHNPTVATGKKPFTEFFIPFFQKFPKASVEIKKSIAEGDLVVLHVLFKIDENDRGSAVVDIFRVENGKVAEHWDVIQSIPEKAANENTMF